MKDVLLELLQRHTLLQRDPETRAFRMIDCVSIHSTYSLCHNVEIKHWTKTAHNIKSKEKIHLYFFYKLHRFSHHLRKEHRVQRCVIKVLCYLMFQEQPQGFLMCYLSLRERRAEKTLYCKTLTVQNIHSTILA